eukprot:7594005-Pyramimonas_sp.AAC.1
MAPRGKLPSLVGACTSSSSSRMLAPENKLQPRWEKFRTRARAASSRCCAQAVCPACGVGTLGAA